MLNIQVQSLSVLFAIFFAALMMARMVVFLFTHDRKHEEIDQRVDYSFSVENLRLALNYYRSIAVWMLFFYVVFTMNCLYLQVEGHRIFSDGQQVVQGGPIATTLFGLDLVLRGAFFDFMQHFDLHLTSLTMNRKLAWFVWYCFVFRMFYGLILIKILFSFVWIYGKIRLNRQARLGAVGSLQALR